MAIDTEQVIEDVEGIDEAGDEIMQAILEGAGKAEQPGTMTVRQMVHQGDADLPVSIAVASLKSAGYHFVYDTLTGERSLVNDNQLGAQLRKQRGDSSRIFTLKKPDKEPVRGKFKCVLHPESPDRAHHDELGFPTCPKSNLMTRQDMLLHMKHRHTRQWDVLEEERTEREKAEERLLRRAILRQAARGARAEVEADGFTDVPTDGERRGPGRPRKPSEQLPRTQ